ncbi:hypothetical protein GCM10020219_004130 [Nonomuraea dietziae]
MPDSLRRLLAHLKMDLGPLRDSRDYRLLMASGVITMFGTFITMVAVPYQMKQLTGSYVAVGLVSLAEFVPMVICGLWGGAIADALDRRKVILLSEVGLLVTSAMLTFNAMLPEPQIWVLYVVGALSTGLASLQRPSMEALIPQVVRHDQLGAGGRAGQPALEHRRHRRPRARRPAGDHLQRGHRLRGRHRQLRALAGAAVAHQGRAAEGGRRPPPRSGRWSRACATPRAGAT